MYNAILEKVSSRLVIGLTMAGSISLLLYYEYTRFILYCLNLAIIYDTFSLTLNGVNRLAAAILCLLMIQFNLYLRMAFLQNSWLVVEIAVITQLSDAYQYWAGTRFGKNQIGWISKNKTYEGYIGGYIMTVLSLFWIYSFYEITVIYVLGVCGGLLSSLFKRSNGVKDYSNLLGPHGGWLDRIDSIILPILLCT